MTMPSGGGIHAINRARPPPALVEQIIDERQGSEVTLAWLLDGVAIV